jgi:hypothetical protein
MRQRRKKLAGSWLSFVRFGTICCRSQSIAQIVADHVHGLAQNLACFFRCHPREEAHLNQFNESGIFSGEALQALVDGQDIDEG